MSDNTIWKFELEVTDLQEVVMPSGAEILSVGNQDGKLCLWAMVSPTATQDIEIIGTGNTIPHTPSYVERVLIGTVIMPPFVWHVFERHYYRSE
jgi:hypothetical protein